MDINKAATALVSVSLIGFVVAGLGTSVVAAIFGFSLIHNAFENFTTSALPGSSLDFLISNLSGGFIDLGDITSVLIAAVAVVGLVLGLRDLK